MCTNMAGIYCNICKANISDAGPVGRKHLREKHGIETDVMTWADYFSNTKREANASGGGSNGGSIFDIYRRHPY